MADIASSYKLVYVTGAPATGKSTLCSAVERAVQPLVWYSYSTMLSEHISSRAARGFTECEMRSRSAQIITPSDVAAVDAMLLSEVSERRASAHILVDSHAVTKESYGYRVTPFSWSNIRQLSPDLIVVLFADPHTIIERMAVDCQGRPQVTSAQVEMHNQLQAAVALHYSIACGKPAYLLDSSRPVDELVSELADRLHH